MTVYTRDNLRHAGTDLVAGVSFAALFWFAGWNGRVFGPIILGLFTLMALAHLVLAYYVHRLERRVSR